MNTWIFNNKNSILTHCRQKSSAKLSWKKSKSKTQNLSSTEQTITSSDDALDSSEENSDEDLGMERMSTSFFVESMASFMEDDDDADETKKRKEKKDKKVIFSIIGTKGAGGWHQDRGWHQDKGRHQDRGWHQDKGLKWHFHCFQQQIITTADISHSIYFKVEMEKNLLICLDKSIKSALLICQVTFVNPPSIFFIPPLQGKLTYICLKIRFILVNIF